MISFGQLKRFWFMHDIKFALHLKLYFLSGSTSVFHASVIVVFHSRGNFSTFNKYLLVRYFLLSFPRLYFENVQSAKSCPHFALLKLSRDLPLFHSDNEEVIILTRICQSPFLIPVKMQKKKSKKIGWKSEKPFPTSPQWEKKKKKLKEEKEIKIQGTNKALELEANNILTTYQMLLAWVWDGDSKHKCKTHLPQYTVSSLYTYTYLPPTVLHCLACSGRYFQQDRVRTLIWPGGILVNHTGKTEFVFPD